MEAKHLLPRHRSGAMELCDGEAGFPGNGVDQVSFRLLVEDKGIAQRSDSLVHGADERVPVEALRSGANGITTAIERYGAMRA